MTFDNVSICVGGSQYTTQNSNRIFTKVISSHWNTNLVFLVFWLQMIFCQKVRLVDQFLYCYYVVSIVSVLSVFSSRDYKNQQVKIITSGIQAQNM